MPSFFSGTNSANQARKDAELEALIRDLGRLMESEHAAYERTGCFSHKGNADRFRLQMEDAIKRRSPEQVERLEQERGLSRA